MVFHLCSWRGREKILFGLPRDVEADEVLDPLLGSLTVADIKALFASIDL